MSGGYDIVTNKLTGTVHLVAWLDWTFLVGKSAPTREEAIANMRIQLAKRRVLGI